MVPGPVVPLLLHGGARMLHLNKPPDDILGTVWQALGLLLQVLQQLLGGKVVEDYAHDAQIDHEMLQELVHLLPGAVIACSEPDQLCNGAGEGMECLHNIRSSWWGSDVFLATKAKGSEDVKSVCIAINLLQLDKQRGRSQQQSYCWIQAAQGGYQNHHLTT